MKHIRSVLFVILFTAYAAFAQTSTISPATGADTSVTASWTPPNAPTGLTITGYTVTFTGPTGGVDVVTVTGATTNTATWTATGKLYCGLWTAAIVVNATNSAAKALTSSPVSATGTEPCTGSAPVTTVPPVTGAGIKFNPGQ